MNAKEARELAENKNSLDFEKQSKDIFDLISKEAKNGGFHVWIYEPLIGGIREALVDEGYTVGKSTDDRDGINTQINW